MINKSNFNRVFALLICTCFIFIFLFCESFIIGHVNHECTNDNCIICALIQNAENIINQFGRLLFYVSIIFSLLFATMLLTIEKGFHYAKLSPIDLKVRMNN